MKQNTMLKIVVLAVSMLVVGCGNTKSSAGGGDAEAFNKAYAEANAAADKAKKVNSEWRDIRWKKSTAVKVKGKDGKTVKTSYLGAAKMYAEMGDYAKAMKYVKIAKDHAKLGYEQAMSQKNAAVEGPKYFGLK